MKFLEDVFFIDTVEIYTTPEKIFNFLYDIVDDESYRAWHPNDHVTWRWLKGPPWQEGSVGYAEEYFVGKLHKLKFIVNEVVPNKTISYMPFSKYLRRYVPKMGFAVEAKGDSCIFTATIHGRVPLLLKLIAKKRIEKGLASVKQHMREEGENLKFKLESDSVT